MLFGLLLPYIAAAITTVPFLGSVDGSRPPQSLHSTFQRRDFKAPLTPLLTHKRLLNTRQLHTFGRRDNTPRDALLDTEEKAPPTDAAKKGGKGKKQPNKKGKDDGVPFDGTQLDLFCSKYNQKGSPPVPDDIKCPGMYDVNAPENALDQYAKLGIPVDGIHLYHHGWNMDPIVPKSQVPIFECTCAIAAYDKTNELLRSWTGNTSAYDLKNGKAPYVTVGIWGHDKKWNPVYVATGCAVLSVSPAFWEHVKFSCGWFDLSQVPKATMKVVASFNQEVNELALGDVPFKRVEYPPKTPKYLDPKAVCTECRDYNPKTQKYDLNETNHDTTNPQGQKCLNGPDVLNKGECMPINKLPAWPKDLSPSMTVDKFCQNWLAQKEHDEVTVAMDPARPEAFFSKFQALGGKIGGVRMIRVPDSSSTDACMLTQFLQEYNVACDCHQLTAAERMKHLAGGSGSPKTHGRRSDDTESMDTSLAGKPKHDHSSNTSAPGVASAGGSGLEYIALSVFGKSPCYNDNYFAAGCAIAKVTPEFYKEVQMQGPFYDISKVDKSNIQIITNYNSKAEVLYGPPIGKGQGLVDAPYPPAGPDAALTSNQKKCLSTNLKGKFSCAGKAS